MPTLEELLRSPGMMIGAQSADMDTPSGHVPCQSAQAIELRRAFDLFNVRHTFSPGQYVKAKPGFGWVIGDRDGTGRVFVFIESFDLTDESCPAHFRRSVEELQENLNDSFWNGVSEFAIVLRQESDSGRPMFDVVPLARLEPIGEELASEIAVAGMAG